MPSSLVDIATDDGVCDAYLSQPEAPGPHPAVMFWPDAIGVRQLRRYALTGERFGAAEARRIGLVHEVVPRAELEAAGERMLAGLLENGPEAVRRPKRWRCARPSPISIPRHSIGWSRAMR